METSEILEKIKASGSAKKEGRCNLHLTTTLLNCHVCWWHKCASAPTGFVVQYHGWTASKTSLPFLAKGDRRNTGSRTENTNIKH